MKNFISGLYHFIIDNGLLRNTVIHSEFIQENIENAKRWKELGQDHCHYFVNDVLRSGDGIDFLVCVECDRNNIVKVLGIAKALGWTFDIVRG